MDSVTLVNSIFFALTSPLKNVDCEIILPHHTT